MSTNAVQPQQALHPPTLPLKVVSGVGVRNQQCKPVESPQPHLPALGRKDVTLRKLDIKVETVNREPLTMHSDREDDTTSISTATRVMKAIYSVRIVLLSFSVA